MANEPFLAMTAAEIHEKSDLPEKIAWMACHFSPYGTGLSNLPRTLPPGSLLILDDITPIRGHDPRRILDQLLERTEALSCSGVLLDFQRAETAATASLVEVLTEGLTCPVAVSHCYAGNGSFPVFLPPVPPCEEPEGYFSLWAGREIWLELALEGMEITVTEKGSSYTPLPFPSHCKADHYEEILRCHYHCAVKEDAVKFTLHRTPEDLESLIAEAANFGVTTTVGLYQEFTAYGRV